MEIKRLSNKENFVEISNFYNKTFPLSPHTEEYKRKIYNYSSFIGFKVIDDGEIIGLIEGWEKDNVTLLATLVVDEKHRGKRIAKMLFEKFMKEVKTKEVVLHFRDTKKDELIPIYTKFGFKVSDKRDLVYNNKEKKWEMSLILEKINNNVIN